jgi:hypothetical protein
MIVAALLFVLFRIHIHLLVLLYCICGGAVMGWIELRWEVIDGGQVGSCYD